MRCVTIGCVAKGFARILLALSCCMCAVSTQLRAVPFIRGDANLDGVVTLSDAYWILVARDHSHLALPCASAANANDDNKVNLADGIWVINALFRNGPAMPAPFPEPGEDPRVDGLGCDSTAGPEAIVDPEAELKVLDAVAPADGPPRISVVVALRGSRSIAGYSGLLRFPEGLLAPGSVRTFSDTKSYRESEYFGDQIHESTVAFAYLTATEEYDALDAADVVRQLGDVRIVDLTACLAPGVAAGDYPITIESGEQVDAASGQRIACKLTPGTLHVPVAVPATSRCAPIPLPDPPDPGTIDAVYRLGAVSAPPGGSAAVPFYIRSNAGVQGYAFSIDFDEESLVARRVEEAWSKPDGSKYGYAVYEFDNTNASPGGEGVDEGFIVGAVVLDFLYPVTFPFNDDVLALRFHFDVKEDAAAGAAALRFQDGGQGSGRPVVNAITAFGEEFLPDELHSFVFLNGVFQILPDVTLFVRGDSNGDGAVNLSDAVTTLSYLFRGTGSPACFDAADADDDGALAITDAIYTLAGLFGGGKQPPAPFPGAGEDPTPDALGCLYRGR
jgi:hypothetical protein